MSWVVGVLGVVCVVLKLCSWPVAKGKCMGSRTLSKFPIKSLSLGEKNLEHRFPFELNLKKC